MKNKIEKVVRKLKEEAYNEAEVCEYDGGGLDDVYPFVKKIQTISKLNDVKKTNRIYNVLRKYNDDAYFHIYECMWDQFDDSFVTKTVNKIEKILVD